MPYSFPSCFTLTNSSTKHHCAKEVKKAAKKAKTFETQKLIKKLKDLRYAPSFQPLRTASSYPSLGRSNRSPRS